jgi:hypothetical protein
MEASEGPGIDAHPALADEDRVRRRLRVCAIPEYARLADAPGGRRPASCAVKPRESDADERAVSHAETVPQGSRFHRWLGVLGPAAVLVWAASQQSWVWVAFSAFTLGFGVARRILGPLRQAQITRLTLWGAGAFLLGMGVLSLYISVRWVTRDVAIAALVLAATFVFVTMGLLVVWPAQTMRVLHIQTRPVSGTYGDSERPAGPNDVLPT